MYLSELDVQAANERYKDLLAEACKQRLIRAAEATSARSDRDAGRVSALIARVVAALHFRRVAHV